MSKAKKVWLIIGLVVLTLALVAVLAFCGLTKWLAGDPKEETLGGDMTYTVQVKNAADTPMEGIGVYIYEDETQQELVWFDKTNAEGKMSFTDAASNKYVAVLDDVPTGYAAEDYYPLTGELTQIVLAAQRMEDIDPEELRYKLGDLMLDFTITDVDGKEHTLSELLKTKKAVVLNFWYVECAPCKAEFPYMQAAYELYKKDLEILAMNPVNTDENAVKAFRDELELTFPMAVVDEVWAQVMQLTAYPTTVVIDRYGNISLIHKGSIDSSDTFEQLFEYFTSDDYVQRPIESIDEIVTKTEGTKENPLQIGGVTQFDVTVQPEQTYYIEIYKLVADIYLTVEGEDFILTYKDKEYKPSDGKVTIFIEPEGTMTAVELQITNTSKKEQKYSLSLANPKGSYGNPYTMKLGEFDVKTSAGNEQGTYYVYTAEKSGTLTLKCLSSSVKDYGFTLYNLRSYALRNTDSDAQKDEEGYTYVSVKVKQGDRIQFIVAVMPDSSRYIPAGSFKFLAELEEGDGEEDKKAELPKTTYTVTVTDEENNPISGVVVNLKGEFTYVYPKEEGTEGEGGTDAESGTDTDTDTETDTGTDSDTETEGGEDSTEPTQPESEDIKVDVNLTTDEKGVVSTEQVSGPYTATIRVPTGYKLENTKFDLTAEKPDVAVKLQKIVMKDYTVKVLYPDGTPVADTLVIVGSGVAYTDENGRVVFNLEEGQYSALVIGAPEDYVVPENNQFAEGATVLVINLGYGPGHETNPIKLSGPKSLTTAQLGNGATEHYQITGVGGSTLKVEGAVGAFVQLNGGEAVNADESGNISIPVPEDSDPLALVVGSNAETAGSITVSFEYPVGTIQNPDTSLRNVRRFSLDIPAGREDGYYMSWTPEKNGQLKLTLRNTSDTNCDVSLIQGSTEAKMADKTVLIRFEKNVPVLIYGIAHPAADGTYPAVGIDFTGTLTYDADPEGTTYSVTVQDASAQPVAGVLVQFMKDGAAVGEPKATNVNGVVEAVLEAGSYTVSFTDPTIIYDAEKAVLTESAPAITLSISYSEEPVPDGMTRYSVSVSDYLGNKKGNVVVLFMQDGSPKGYGIIEQVGASVSADLPTGTYSIQLAFLGGQELYYEETAAIVTAEKPSLEILVAGPPTVAEEENWSLGFVTPLQVGGVYVTTQPDIVNYYTFRATEQGVYEFRVTDPKAVITYWGDVNYPVDGSADVEDYTKWAFTRSINTGALGQNLVVGITGTTDTILVVTRVGDAVEDVPYTEYVPAVAPTEFSFNGKPLTFVDLTAATESYTLVYSETDGYYHIGSATGPILYLQIDANKKVAESPVAPPYIHLYKMVGGVDNTGTALRCVYTDGEGNKVKEDYTAAMLAYGACADDTYGIYPMDKDLLYMLQMGGGYQGWWDAEDKKGNLLFKDEEGKLDPTINLEIGWMFACCYVDDGSVTVIPRTEAVSDEVENVENQAPVKDDQPEALPPEEEQLVPPVEETEPVPSDEEEPEETAAATEPTEVPTLDAES